VRPGAAPFLFCWRLFRWRVLERQLGVTRFLNFDNQSDSSFGIAKREGLSSVFMRNGIHDLQIWVGSALDHAAADLDFLVGIGEVD